jgi:hypothetical protein
MAKLGQVVNADEIEERKGYEPLPPGDYTAMITESEMKPTDHGQMLVLTLEIQDEEFKGRKIFERLNIEHSGKDTSAKTVEIAYQVLGEIIRACGKKTIKDTEELHNKRLNIKVRVDAPKEYTDKKTKEKKMGTAQNSISKYSVFGSSTASAPKQKAVEDNSESDSSEGGETSAPAEKPWKKKK